MKRSIILFVLILLLAISAVMAFEPTTADENDPATNEDANACFIGGTWEGKCSTVDVDQDGTIEQWEIDYMFSVGWYLIRYEYGLLSQAEFPSQYIWVFAPEAALVEEGDSITPPSPPVVVCYDNTVSGTKYDVQYTGVPNISSNLLRFTSTDGTCGGVGLGPAANYYVVVAGSLAAADTLCPLPNVITMAGYGFTTAPGNLYICTSNPI